MEWQLPEAAFELREPAAWHMPVVFNSPHSGRFMPPDLLAKSALSEFQLRQSEDCFVDELIEGCLEHGAALLKATISRAYVDLNREPFELESRLFIETLPAHMHSNSQRATSGFGTVPRCVGDGLNIYRSRLSLSDATARIENVYRPYHRALSALVEHAFEHFGITLLVDCHSMPSRISSHKPAPDIVLGDRFGTSCAPDLVNHVEEFFRNCGLEVVRNRPYAGAFITEAYGAPKRGRNALQLEINRALYMNELTLEPNGGFHDCKLLMTNFALWLKQCFSAIQAPAQRKAAE